jgi:uncharacterized protein (DUF2141 family)
MTKQTFSFWYFVVLSALVAAMPAMAQQSGITISGQITGASGNHPVYVAVWDAAGFLSHPWQQVRIGPHSSTAFRFQVPAGNWAVSAYEDENENGKLDMGMFGPKEPSGFWRPFHAWRKPRFTDVSSAIDKDVSGADIQLHK